MENTTVPVISGGKNLRILLIFNPTRSATTPPIICAPRIVAMSKSDAIACILGTYAKLIPIITGSAEPIRKFFVFINGNNCSNVVSADITSAACIKITESSCEIPATPATMIDGVTHPTIIASTCWIASGKACPIDGFP